MSPEQARGEPVDRRADIWAFGCVLYEMLTGRRAFEGEDVSLTLSQILQREPAFDALPRDVPPRVQADRAAVLEKTSEGTHTGHRRRSPDAGGRVRHHDDRAAGCRRRNGASGATTRAFGVIFTDVDQPDGSDRGYQRDNRPSSTLVESFGVSGELLFSGVVASAPGNGNFSFFGAIFPDARIGRVLITAGDYAGPDDSRTRDVVMMDDFIYAEPRVR